MNWALGIAEDSLRVPIIIAVAACTFARGASGEAIPRDLDAWQVEFTIAGTIQGLAERLTLDHSGNLIAGGTLVSDLGGLLGGLK